MEHSTQILKDLESAITKTHEGILDLLHAIGKIHACETEYVHTVDGLAEVEAAAQEEAAVSAAPQPEAPSAQTATANEAPAQPQEVQEAQDPEPVEDAPEEPAPAAAVYKLEDARAELAQLTRAGRADEARKILASFNAHKLSEVSEEHYGDIIQAVKDIA